MPKTPAKRPRTVARRAAPPLPDHAPPPPAGLPQTKTSFVQPVATPPARIIYCTIATAQELPQALLLGDSLRAAHGPVDFRLLLVEQPAVVSRLRAALPAVTLLAPSELGCAEWRSMAFYYDEHEYAAALKAALLRTLLRAGSVIYLAPDLEVLSPLTALEQQLGAADVVVRPARTGRPPTGQGAGSKPARRQFDLSVIGVGQSAAAVELLARLQAELVEGGHESPEHGLYPEALWAAAFTSAPRLQIMPWQQAELAAEPGRSSALALRAAGAPLPPDGPLGPWHDGPPAERPEGSHKDAPRQLLSVRPARRLAGSPYQRFAAMPYSFGRYESGEPIPLTHRRAVWLLPPVNRQALSDPFAERPYILQLAAQLDAGVGSRSAELAAKRNRLPSSLIGYAGKLAGGLIDRAAPGGRVRVAGAVQEVAARGASARYYAGQLLDQVVPGSRERLFSVLNAATTSPRPAIRRTAAALLSAAGVRS